MTSIPPIHRETVVEASPEIAFAVFTERIGSWWPLADLSVFHDGTVAFVDGRIVETSAAGGTTVWGTVTEWVPPDRLAFTWHPGGVADRASVVGVRFAAVGARTLVTLEHRGWEHYPDPETARLEYGQGWPQVLAGYRAQVGDGIAQDGDAEAATWVALLHTATVEGAVFADERFALHVAFLERMHRSGYLVAAGSLDAAGLEGMTVLRLPGEGRLEDARALAEADLSVITGLFAVRVRPWHVALSPLGPGDLKTA